MSLSVAAWRLWVFSYLKGLYTSWDKEDADRAEGGKSEVFLMCGFINKNYFIHVLIDFVYMKN